ncbi:uncharacterized protein LOC131022999 [Salvia miltiorrhiza]|uniref:uncharacterized protein LOC131022999 n=1 Tax=Salvia miltiorrhiza TaxID=226208 RepID=UPI0025AB94FA|nr:uncharacterized protein LOC131022999 [Salvia miltiorrhiza]
MGTYRLIGTWVLSCYFSRFLYTAGSSRICSEPHSESSFMADALMVLMGELDVIAALYMLRGNGNDRAELLKTSVEQLARNIHMLVAAWGYSFSSQLACFWKAGIISLIWSIWTQRNNCIFDDDKFEAKKIFHSIKVTFREMEENFKLGAMANTWEDLSILKKIGIKGRAAIPPDFINVYWWPPSNHWIKVNTDGSALGAPGKIAAGGVFRDNHSTVRGCFHKKRGIGYAFEAELLAVITAIQYANDRNWFYLWLESDSTYIVRLIQDRSLLVPWRFMASWKRILVLLDKFHLYVSHIYREGNKVADILAADTR